jgi:hypothetical protein
MATGITRRHRKGCSRRGRCECPWEAWVWSNRDGRKIAKRFGREAEAKSWRADALSALDKGSLRAPKPTTVEQAWQAWYAAAREGSVRNRSGDLYKPASLRTYEAGMRRRVLPELGSTRLADLRRPAASWPLIRATASSWPQCAAGASATLRPRRPRP